MYELVLQILKFISGIVQMLDRNWNTTVQARTCLQLRHSIIAVLENMLTHLDRYTAVVRV